MIDPLTALATASAAVSQLKNLANTGRDISSALSNFAGAWSDINEAERRAKNPSFVDKFNGSLEQNAAKAFTAKKKAQELKKELESIIQFVYGPSGLREYKETLRAMREQKRKTEYRKAERKRKLLEWTVGIAVALVSISILGVIFYFIGKSQGKW